MRLSIFSKGQNFLDMLKFKNSIAVEKLITEKTLDRVKSFSRVFCCIFIKGAHKGVSNFAIQTSGASRRNE